MKSLNSYATFQGILISFDGVEVNACYHNFIQTMIFDYGANGKFGHCCNRMRSKKFMRLIL